MFFEDTEVDVVTALTAEEGLRAIRSDHFDAILCDLGMDDINGLEVGQRVKEYCRSAGKPKIPFLLYTGLEKELDSKKLSDFGVDRIVKKTDSMRRSTAAHSGSNSPAGPDQKNGLKPTDNSFDDPSQMRSNSSK